MSDKIKFAVVGTGHIGKRHAAMITNNTEAELVALCDIQPKEKLGIDNFQVPFYNSLTDLLQEGPAFDVLCVTSPNGLHEEHALMALESGHHVVVEKPLSLTKSLAVSGLYMNLFTGISRYFV